jgi:hypothetical protein
MVFELCVTGESCIAEARRVIFVMILLEVYEIMYY